jgi:hypothetical protein
VSVHGFNYRATAGYPPSESPAKPVEATTGIEPVDRINRMGKRNLRKRKRRKRTQ